MANEEEGRKAVPNSPAKKEEDRRVIPKSPAKEEGGSGSLSMDDSSSSSSNNNDNNNNNNNKKKGGSSPKLKKQRSSSVLGMFGSRRSKSEKNAIPPESWIPQLSPIANYVVFRCSRILLLSPSELQNQFENDMSDDVKSTLSYARNLLEYCSYRAIHSMNQKPYYLGDKEFRRLTYDMMLAWETPGTESETMLKENVVFPVVPKSLGAEDEDSSLFYANSIKVAVQVDDKQTVGPQAFARIAPASPAISDVITVHNLFDALTGASCGQLHYLIYDKYLTCLDKAIRNAKSLSGSPLSLSLELAEGEVILDIDGSIPTKPVLRHIGLSVWPGRLTLSSRAVYFESVRVGSYNKHDRYDLATDLNQTVKSEYTGPLGAKLFNKAVSYKSASMGENVSMEFPEFKSTLRRDYWLSIMEEVLHVHRFIRKFELKGGKKAEALSKAILAIFRCRALRDAFRILPSGFKSILPYNLAEVLPRGDEILETLSGRLDLLSNSNLNLETSSDELKMRIVLHPVSFLTVSKFGFVLLKEAYTVSDSIFLKGDVCVGEANPMELALGQSKHYLGKAEAAQASIEQVKAEGIDTNIALMKELLSPVVELMTWIRLLSSWDDPFKSVTFLIIFGLTIFKGWLKYVVPYVFLFFAMLMLWRNHQDKGKQPKVVKVNQPPPGNPWESLLKVQEGVSQIEALIRTANITLLKVRALFFALHPQSQAVDRVAVILIVVALVLLFIPPRFTLMFLFAEVFTRKMPLRREASQKTKRRIKEWWVRVPAAPVEVIKLEDNKKRK